MWGRSCIPPARCRGSTKRLKSTRRFGARRSGPDGKNPWQGLKNSKNNRERLKTKGKAACFAGGFSHERIPRKTISRVLYPALRRNDDHSSGRAVASPLEQPTRATSRKQAYARPLFGLASGEVCRAVPVARSAVGSYPAVSPLPPKRRFVFCCTVCRIAPPGRYPAPYFREARTFLTF